MGKKFKLVEKLQEYYNELPYTFYLVSLIDNSFCICFLSLSLCFSLSLSIYICTWWLRSKAPQPMQETQVQSLGQENTLEKEMATHSSILAWRIPWTEELGRLQSTGS